MKKSEFLAAIMASRMLFMVPEVLILLVFARYAFGVVNHGSLTAVVVLVLLGSLMFSGHRAAGRLPGENDRGRVGHDEPGDDPDVDLLRDLLFVGAISGSHAAVHQGDSADAADRRLAERDARRRAALVAAHANRDHGGVGRNRVCLALRWFRLALDAFGAIVQHWDFDLFINWTRRFLPAQIGRKWMNYVS